MSSIEEWKKDPTYSAIPYDTLLTFKRYIDQGIKPGGFTQALLANDLALAIGRADQQNFIILRRLVTFVNCQVPSKARGSWEKVNSWIQKGGEKREK